MEGGRTGGASAAGETAGGGGEGSRQSRQSEGARKSEGRSGWVSGGGLGGVDAWAEGKDCFEMLRTLGDFEGARWRRGGRRDGR